MILSSTSSKYWDLPKITFWLGLLFTKSQRSRFNTKTSTRPITTFKDLSTWIWSRKSFRTTSSSLRVSYFWWKGKPKLVSNSSHKSSIECARRLKHQWLKPIWRRLKEGKKQVRTLTPLGTSLKIVLQSSAPKMSLCLQPRWLEMRKTIFTLCYTSTELMAT